MKPNKNRKAPGEAGLTNLYNSYRKEARLRQLQWAIDKDLFRELTKHNCYYCNSPPSFLSPPYKSKKHSPEALKHATYMYNGLDRVDNTQGYFEENLVPCCKHCNVAKFKRSSTDFIKWSSTVYDRKYHELNGPFSDYWADPDYLKEE